MKGYISHGIETSNKSCSKQRANHRGKCALECLYSWLSVGAIGWSLANEIIQHLPLSRKTLGIRIRSEAPFLLSVNVGFDDLQVCADPGVPENGFRTPSGGVFFESSVTRFHCQDGFKLKGSTKRLCMKHLNGTLGWIPSDRPVCVQEGKVLTPPPPSSQEATHVVSLHGHDHKNGRLCAGGGSTRGCSLCFRAHPAS